MIGRAISNSATSKFFPDDGTPINEWDPESKGWQNAVKGIRKTVDRMLSQAEPASDISEKDIEAETVFQHGNLLLKLKKMDMAIEAYSEAIRLKSDYVHAYRNRGAAYNEKGENGLAIKDYNKAIELNPTDGSLYNNRGNAYNDKGEFTRAINDYYKAIELYRKHPYPYNGCGEAYRKKGDIDQAIEYYTKAIKLQPDYHTPYNGRGEAYREKEEFDKAIENYTEAIELKPDYPLPYSNRGIAYRRTGKYDLAIKDYTKAIELKPDFVEVYNNRGNVYSDKGEFDRAIEDYTKAIELKPDYPEPYNNRGEVYSRKGEFRRAIKDYNKAIDLNGDYANAYNNRAEASLHLKEWSQARADLKTAKSMGMDIVALFHNEYKSVEKFEKHFGFKLPEDIAHLLTERLRTRYPKTRRFLDAEGNPIESPNVVNLRAQLRDAGTPLGEYVKSKPSFGINTAPTEAFVVDKAMRDELIASHPGSAEILKPFLHGEDIRRWHVDTPHQWLIFTHRGIAINDYLAILKHLEKYQETLSQRKGKHAWYELAASLDDAERFAQPKLVCPDTYNHQTFAVDTAGYYYGKTAYLIPTEERWLCGLLNSRTVEWFYSQTSKQLTIDYLRARSRYIQQIPIPHITPVHKALIAKIVDYLIYLQQQPEINSKDLEYARDRIMLGYFERVIDGLVYEAYLPAELHKSDKVFLQPLLDEGLPSIEEIQGDKMSAFRDIFELLYDRMHLVRRHLYYLDSIKPVRIIQGKL